ncbi:hypothetical protein LZK98_08290 [Sphingomonas cannabina]|uniref:hypothetical protein n=1 Tax=Sphingomonas cannabina TaxID=2899123 RepID=UPI001F31AEAE|nr:hypothetical protein [Sphingomonas cannabina]UIJ46928.1 hypothetical protein LZK98_08290 [Sphingomonas cannabina]
MTQAKHLPAKARPSGAAALARLRSHPRARLPKLWELPIPRDVQPGRGWTSQMREMADHIGAYATLTIVATFGGEQLRVPYSAERSPFRNILDQETVATIASVYGGNRISIPVARTAVDTARRAVVIAAVRAEKLTAADAARIIGTSRTYISHLVNGTDEGQNTDLAASVDRLEPQQRDLFALLLPAK